MRISTMSAMLAVLALPAAGQEQSVVVCPREHASSRLTGVPSVDLVGQSELWDRPPMEMQDEGVEPATKKSPWLAAGMSLLVPGSGEIYAESYLKGAIFLAVEAGLVAAAIIYDGKGDDQTAFYENYANQHWSVVQYGTYTQNFEIPSGAHAPLWYAGGQVNWDSLNAMERLVGGYYSHTLPAYGTQQYYELIGKYPQYNQGWDDAADSVKYNYGDPLTPSFLYYSGERGKANDYYDRAATAVTVLVVNHVLSALDAAWSASQYNSKIHAHASLRLLPNGPKTTTAAALTLSYTLR